ncbi:MAG: hypothetical protein HPY45_17845 [Anaerolineae bacterium]|nr:hypothetical protein [Anaerolineae bacterium]
MYTDLFLALADPRNQPPHAITAALAYVFCPTAARWWLNGARPTPAYDPVWHALTRRSEGKTLKETLIEYGMETLVDEMRSYVTSVEQYRARLPYLHAPETLPTFPGVTLDPVKRSLCSRALQEHFGGEWRNLTEYVRAWAFLIQDWERGAKLEAEGENTSLHFSLMTLAFTLPGSKKPVYFPAWMWTRKQNYSIRLVIGLFVLNLYEQDELRFGLTLLAGPDGDQPFPRQPDIFACEYASGRTSPPDTRLTVEQLTETVKNLYMMARDGHAPPLGVLQGGEKCRLCGYRSLCWTGMSLNQLSPLVFGR